MPTTPEQIDSWRAAKSETDRLEFKDARNHFDFERLLEYCVALANENGGKLLLGIAGKPPYPIVGTVAFPDIEKTARAIQSRLKLQVDVEDVTHADGRILVFHIPPRPVGQPQSLGGTYLIRRGQSLGRMTPAQLEQAFRESKYGLKQKIAARSSDPYKPITLAGSALLLVILLVALYRWHGENTPTTYATATVQHPDPHFSIKPGKDWHDKKNWQKSLHVGMTKDDVRRLFGEAETIDVTQNFETWHYGFGSITFYEEKIYSWLEPD